MKKTIKTSDILDVFNLISNAKYGKMTDEDKIKAWRITRILKPFATKFDEDSKSAYEKLKPKIESGFDETLQKAQEFEVKMRDAKTDPKDLPMGVAEYEAFVKKYKEYEDLTRKALEKFANKEVEVEFEPLSEDGLASLMASNDWTFKHVAQIGDVICE